MCGYFGSRTFYLLQKGRKSMKAIVCEMCGSHDVVKSDGFYVCQACGTKYSTEEAKKLVVEISGEVKVDFSDKITNLCIIAEQAMDSGNFADAVKNCDEAIALDAKCIKAWYIKALSATRTSSLKNIQLRASFSALKQLIALIDDETADRYTNDVCTVVERTVEMLIGNSVGMPTTNACGEYMEKTLNHFASAVALLEQPEKVADREAKFIREKLMRSNQIVGHRVVSQCFDGFRILKHETADIYFLKAVKQAKPSANIAIPQSTAQTSSSSGGGGCYVATCVYGSYDCPQVWTLRRYRDNVLAASFWGRMFIRTYYACSPTIVKWFGNVSWFKKLWKKPLDRIVTKLQLKGTEATPYDDRMW